MRANFYVETFLGAGGGWGGIDQSSVHSLSNIQSNLDKNSYWLNFGGESCLGSYRKVGTFTSFSLSWPRKEMNRDNT